MLLVAIAWLYVVVLMALVEGTSDHGTWLGAFFTLLWYGLLPLAVALYVLATPSRRARRQRAASRAKVPALGLVPGVDPDGGGHPPGATVAPVGKEP
ncbi:MAG: hypothetical protein M3Z16_10680 [Pseudomonadota bacterium]|nr:hypothetical protein [Pseudomonadota bacterium]